MSVYDHAVYVYIGIKKQNKKRTFGVSQCPKYSYYTEYYGMHFKRRMHFK